MRYMEVTVISPTIQEFDGQRYYLCGKYFRRRAHLLHRMVWASAHGVIQKGMHIHHVDHDRTNNQLGNLHAMPMVEHLSHHGSTPTQAVREAARQNQKIAMEWHSTPEGRRWHAAHAKKQWENHPVVVLTCTVCQRQYETSFPSRSKFCHPNCKAKAFRKRRALNQ